MASKKMSITHLEVLFFSNDIHMISTYIIINMAASVDTLVNELNKINQKDLINIIV